MLILSRTPKSLITLLAFARGAAFRATLTGGASLRIGGAMGERPSALHDTGAEQHIVLRPNRSLSSRGLRTLLTGVVAVVALLALTFAAMGAWPVVPFLGAEFLALALVLWVMGRHLGDCEVISLAAERLCIVKREAGRESRHEFPRCWTRIDVVRRGSRLPRVFVRLRGRRVEVGAALNERDRLRLASVLRQAVGAGHVLRSISASDAGFFA
jgi:uncharacterized membrane protein